MILLDTNAILWMLTGHGRSAPLSRTGARLFVSPVSLLELSFLREVGKLKIQRDSSLMEVVEDDRWQLDNPSSEALFRAALPLSWTRDPFDRLLVAHASHRRWRFATGDSHILETLSPESSLRL